MFFLDVIQAAEVIIPHEPINIVKKELSVWGTKFFTLLPNVLSAILIFSLFFFIGRFTKRYYIKIHLKILEKRIGSVSSSERRLPTIIGNVLNFLFLLFGLIIVIETLHLGSILNKLLAGVGIIGIILGVALQGMASSLFAGLLMSIEKPFQIGDSVILNGVTGMVVDIGFITTKLISITGEIVFVPNQTIFAQPFSNLTSSGKRKVVIDLGVSYDDSLEHVKQSTIDEVAQLAFVEKSEPIEVFFMEVGSSTYNYSVRFWIHISPELSYLSAKSETIAALKKRYEKENINLAYPTQTIDFSSKTTDTLIDKLRIFKKA